jgi:hypothetical protein
MKQENRSKEIVQSEMEKTKNAKMGYSVGKEEGEK